MTSPAEQLAAKKPRKRAPRNIASPRNLGWVCRLRGLRESLNLSMRDVALGTGMSIANLHMIEHGADPQLTTARKLSVFFGASMDYLWPCRKDEA